MRILLQQLTLDLLLSARVPLRMRSHDKHRKNDATIRQNDNRRSPSPTTWVNCIRLEACWKALGLEFTHWGCGIAVSNELRVLCSNCFLGSSNSNYFLGLWYQYHYSLGVWHCIGMTQALSNHPCDTNTQYSYE